MRLVSVLCLTVAVLSTPSQAQQGPPPEIRAIIDGLVQAANDGGEDAMDRFLSAHVSEAWVEATPRDTLLTLFDRIARIAAGADDLGVERTDRGLAVHFNGPQGRGAVFLAMDFEPPFKVSSLALEENGSSLDSPPRSLDEAYGVRARALEDLTAQAGPEAIDQFVVLHMVPESVDDTTWDTLREVRRVGAAAGGISISVAPGLVTVGFRGSENADVLLRLEPESPWRVASVQMRPAAGDNRSDPALQLDWDSADLQLSGLVEDGFSGSVLLVRNGEVVLESGYGAADRDTGRPVLKDTQFDIGSTPIAFTRAAVLLLAQQGRLSLDDAIAAHFDDVPSDKRAITIDQLMTGASGLPNFHHRPGDADRDLTFITRQEAISRILSQDLLFQPGHGDSHSHSAWVLLAAVVEQVSGQPYPQFLDQHFFTPAGMTRTAPYGPNPRFTASDQAVGYGSSQVGAPNIPLNWGPTSWLIMGSGGMVSTPGDLLRWHQYVRSGSVLKGEWLSRLPEAGLTMGGTDRGFLNVIAFRPGEVAILCTNSSDGPDSISDRVAQALIRQVGSGSGSY